MSVDIDRNKQLVKALKRVSTPENAGSGYTVDGYEVRVHPDLVARLRELMIYVPAARFEYVFGAPVLCTAAGMIFASVSGTVYLNLRLPKEADWGTHYEEYDELWRQGPAWARRRSHTQEDEDRLAALLREAYSAEVVMNEY
jgi:hypothetical protein